MNIINKVKSIVAGVDKSLPGNRASRRRDEAYKKHLPTVIKKAKADQHMRLRAEQRRDKVARRVKRAQTRKAEREAAKKAGKPVVYSIK